MIFSLFSQPMLLLVWVSVIVISITVHEFSHAFVASKLGDKTAEFLGRLTLNPLKHIDPLGFLALLTLGFGWAKPVPYNPYNLPNPRKQAVFIALAGPASNLILALLSGVILRTWMVAGGFSLANLGAVFLVLMILVNLFLLFFNLIPVHPLDGSKLLDLALAAPKYQAIRQRIAQLGPQVLLFLVILSILTPLNIFGFISVPSFYVCEMISGGICLDILTAIF